MANEAFALSPISARSTSPTDADYEAIREAFMETSRGRWFLHEYTKRNRNADTAMVLDAVARIEHSLAAAKAATAEPEPQGPSAEELLARVECILREVRASIIAILGEPVEAEGLTPFRRNARIIQEIAWGLRESGADVRICDLLDGQVRSINAASNALSASGRDTVLQEIDDAIIKIRQLFDENSETTAGDEQDIAAADDLMVPEAELSAEPQASVSDVRALANALATDAVEAETADTESMGAIQAEAVHAVAMDAEVIDLDAVEPDVSGELQTEALPATESAVEPSEPPPTMEAATLAVTDAAAGVSPGMLAETPAQPEAITMEMMETTLTATNLEASLGAHLIAQGIVAQTKAPPDLLAPIRRMSQAEKIAFFS